MAAVAANPLLQESIWFDRRKFEEAETLYHERLYQQKYGGTTEQACPSTLVNEIKRAREHIQKSMEPPSSPAKAAAAHTGGAAPTGGTAPKGGHGQDAALAKRLDNLENENKDLRKVTEDLRSMMTKMEARISAMDKGGASGQTTGKPPAAAKKESSSEEEEEEDMDLFGSDPPAAAKKESSSAEDTEEDMDLFGSDDEEEEAERERIKQERIAAYQEKKTKKPAIVAKSNVIFDVKPWDDTTDMKKVEELVRTIEMEGLRWGAGKLVDLAYGIKKLQICCIVEDEKVSTEDVEDLIRGFEDYVQSTDIAAFQKI